MRSSVRGITRNWYVLQSVMARRRSATMRTMFTVAVPGDGGHRRGVFFPTDEESGCDKLFTVVYIDT